MCYTLHGKKLSSFHKKHSIFVRKIQCENLRREAKTEKHMFEILWNF